jgi:excisionase family DNA binding protein
MQLSEYLTAESVAQRLSISRATVYVLVKQHHLPQPYHFGRAARWKLSELEAAERSLSSATSPRPDSDAARADEGHSA